MDSSPLCVNIMSLYFNAIIARAAAQPCCITLSSHILLLQPSNAFPLKFVPSSRAGCMLSTCIMAHVLGRSAYTIVYGVIILRAPSKKIHGVKMGFCDICAT